MHAQTWPAISSAQATVLGSDWQVFGFSALAVLLLVWGLILYSAIRFRRTKRNPEPRSQKEQNTALELTWTILPLLFVIALFVFTFRIESSVEALQPNPAVKVAVNGYRWGWTFTYAGGPTINGTNMNPPELVLPIGQLAATQLTSSDVDHAFWIPDMLFKRDALPGRVSAFDLTPTKLGTYIGRCAEFCGLNHALMTFTVRVVTPDEYRRWLRYEATQ